MLQQSGESRRKEERRAAVAQLLEENREGLGLKVIAVINQRYGMLPRELWDLSSLSDNGAGRRFAYVAQVTIARYNRVTANHRYSIIDLTISRDIAHKIQLPATLRRLSINAETYKSPLNPLPVDLLELIFSPGCTWNDEPLVLPHLLQKLVLHNAYNKQLNLPPLLVELELGSAYSHPLLLPRRLKRLTFHSSSEFNLPVALPPRLRSIYFGDSYNQPTVLPTGIEEIRMGSAFNYEISLPHTLRKIEWCCNHPPQIPENVSEIIFGASFDQPVVLPTRLQQATFNGSMYSHQINFPIGLKQLIWSPEDYSGFALPESLQKLTWGPASGVGLPSELKELVVVREAPLDFW